MESKMNSLKEHISFLYSELENKEQEIDNLKKSLDDANDKCRRKTTSINSDQHDILELKNIVEEQKVKILCLRKHRNEILDRHEKVIDDYELEFKSKENDIRMLQEDSKHQRNEINDLKEELSAKHLEIAKQREGIQKMESKTSSSLSEEIKIANLEIKNAKLEKENEVLESKVEQFKEIGKKKTMYFAKMEEISDAMKNDLENLKSRITELSKKQKKEKCNLEWRCNRIFCNLDHTYLFRKINPQKIPSDANLSKKTSSETPGNKMFKCDECSLKVSRKSQLSVHKRLKHQECANFSCTHCSFNCVSDMQLVRHVKKKHTFTCTKCDRAFITKKDLEEHEKGHLEKDIVGANNVEIKKQRKRKVSKPKNIEALDILAEQKDDDANEIEPDEDNSSVSGESEMSSITSSSNVSSVEERDESGEEYL